MHWEASLGAAEIGWFLLIAAAVNGLIALSNLTRRQPVIAAHFSPKGGCMAAIVAELGMARSEILVQAYSFSCPDIARALIAAAGRRVRVVVLLDRSNEVETYSELGDLEKHGLEVWIDAVHAIAHNKVMVIDGKTVLTGSFNFTRQAELENAENLLILKHHNELAARYRTNLLAHRGHCHRPGTGKPVRLHSRGAEPKHAAATA
ncbi:MAG TPA: phospholipase D family protein [Urbifossiella sp.]|jgi:phosphatidylserine/phosphatidylglycerophosphate/cardiolipin synthase-like enzyme